MTYPILKAGITDSQERETAQYIADLILELRNIARSANLLTLLGLLEITYCEAFSVANKVTIPEGEMEKLKRLVRAATEI